MLIDQKVTLVRKEATPRRSRTRVRHAESVVIAGLCPRQDSNLRTRLRRPMLYPLSYEGRDVAPA